jgi:SAM-dependent methyltransferase
LEDLAMEPTQSDTFFDEAGDRRMEEQNVRNWAAIVDHISSATESLPGRPWNVLDFGCHTGGLLRMLQSRPGIKPRSFAGVEPLKGPRSVAERLFPGGNFFSSITDVPDECCDVVVSHEALYLVEDLPGWVRELKRILHPDGGAFIALGSHGENTAWLRWREKLERLYGHVSRVHHPMEILRQGEQAGFDMEIGHLHLRESGTRRYSHPEDGWGEFDSVEEMLDFDRQKLLFVFYPKR